MDRVTAARPLALGGASAYVVAILLFALAPRPHTPAGEPVASGANGPIVVRVDADAPLESLYAALEPLCGDGNDPCVFVFGHAALSLPRVHVRIECKGRASIDGFIVRGEKLHERLLADAGVVHWALLMWADGQLWLTHPSGPGRGELPDEPADLAVDFFPKDDGELGAVVPALAHAGNVLALVMVWLRSD